MKKYILGIATLLLLSGCANTQSAMVFTETTDLNECGRWTAISDIQIGNFQDNKTLSDKEKFSLISKIIVSSSLISKYCPLSKESRANLTRNMNSFWEKRQQLKK